MSTNDEDISQEQQINDKTNMDANDSSPYSQGRTAEEDSRDPTQQNNLEAEYTQQKQPAATTQAVVDSKPTQECSTSSPSTINSAIPKQTGLNRTQPTPNSSQARQNPMAVSIESQLEKSKRDLESMVIKYATSERENLQNKAKLDDLDKKLKRAIKDNDSLANRIKLLQNDKSQLTDTLNAKVAQLTVLEQKNLNLNSTQGVRLKEVEEELEKLGKVNEDLLKQIETYKSKEGELLDFSERLSMKHMLLQTELSNLLNEKPNLKQQYEETLKAKDDLVRLNESLLEELNQSKEMNANLREELVEVDSKHRRHIDELENEMKVMRRKHQMATKELLKQVKQLQAELNSMSDKHNNKILI